MADSVTLVAASPLLSLEEFLTLPANNLKTLTTIDLTMIYFPDYYFTNAVHLQKFQKLCFQLSCCQQLQSLNLASTNIFSLPLEQLKQIFQILTVCCENLTTLDLSNITLDPATLAQFITLLIDDKLAKIVNLKLNSALYGLTVAKIKELFTAIKQHMPQLQVLELMDSLPPEIIQEHYFAEFNEIFTDLIKSRPITINFTNNAFTSEQIIQLQTIEQQSKIALTPIFVGYRTHPQAAAPQAATTTLEDEVTTVGKLSTTL